MAEGEQINYHVNMSQLLLINFHLKKKLIRKHFRIRISFKFAYFLLLVFSSEGTSFFPPLAATSLQPTFSVQSLKQTLTQFSDFLNTLTWILNFQGSLILSSLQGNFHLRTEVDLVLLFAKSGFSVFHSSFAEFSSHLYRAIIQCLIMSTIQLKQNPNFQNHEAYIKPWTSHNTTTTTSLTFCFLICMTL